MPFCTSLAVRHLDGKAWQLTSPLVWEGGEQLYVIRSGFETDFASIPKPMRWLLDNAGANSEAAVLHDAVWRESKRPDRPRVDPADADGMFRRALRETGATALTRGLMWFGVRAAAIVKGRYGAAGPPRVTKLAQLTGMGVLGLVTAGVPTVIAAVGLVLFWPWNWLVALVWRGYEKRRFPGFAGNWPWPSAARSTRRYPPLEERLVILPLASEQAAQVIQAIVDRMIDDEALDPILGEGVRSSR
ncbi:MAG: DUF1353 domain-containing protein [Acidimicrobiales bacterium]